MTTGWTKSYYEALEFFYWEPQHLGKKKLSQSSVNSVEAMHKALSRLEVVLNHHFDFFLQIAPTSFRNVWFERLFGTNFQGNFHVHDHSIENKFWNTNVLQPDLFFTSNHSVVSIEMKIKAKSSKEQVVKYALLGLLHEIETKREYDHFLAFIAPNDFRSLWKEKFIDAEDLKFNINEIDISTVLGKCPLDLSSYKIRLMNIISNFQIGFMSYSGFVQLLLNIKPNNLTATPAEEAYCNLIDGLVGELEMRKLV